GPQPDGSQAEFEKYGRNRLSEGKLPVCDEQCGTKALLAGDANVIAAIYKKRVDTRGYGPELWGWDIAYDPDRRRESGPHDSAPRTNQRPGSTQ
ncbi:hypothetical protein OFB63_30530, partial [Escherichia coli]|nr:hypothetical protein [Escherichia coli]